MCIILLTSYLFQIPEQLLIISQSLCCSKPRLLDRTRTLCNGKSCSSPAFPSGIPVLDLCKNVFHSMLAQGLPILNFQCPVVLHMRSQHVAIGAWLQAQFGENTMFDPKSFHRGFTLKGLLVGRFVWLGRLIGWLQFVYSPFGELREGYMFQY